MMHTGKIKGAFGDVLPKVKTLRGAMRVITPEGRGVVLVDMGKPVASYLKAGETTYRGRESLEILESEPLAEYDLVAYEENEFSEAMGICADEGLQLEDAWGPPMRQIGAAVSTGVQKGGGLLSQLFRRFGGGEKQAAPVSPPSPPPPPAREEKVPEPVPRSVEGAEQGEFPAARDIPEPKPSPPPVTAPRESELSAIMKRLARSREEGNVPAASPKPTEAPPASAAAPESELFAVMKRLSRAKEEAPPASAAPAPEIPAGPREEPSAAGPEEDTLAEILKRYKSTAKAPAPEVPRETTPLIRGKTPGVPGDRAEQSRVELNAMMKRITRLDIVSFKKEMEEVKTAVHHEEAGGQPALDLPGEALSLEPVPPPPVRAEEPVPDAVSPPESTRPSSDIDDLKAFIRRLEALELGTPEPVPERDAGRSMKPPEPAGETPAPVPKEVPGITIRPGVLTPGVPAGKGVPAAAAGAGPRKAPPLRFGEPLEADRAVERRPVVLSDAPSAAEKPSPEVIIQWKKDETLSGAAAGTIARAGEVREEIPQRRPVILKREIDIRRVERRPERPRPSRPLLDEKKIDKIMRQPGVIAVSVFQEGFAVQSVGQADFDQVAANAEDLLRAGIKIASDIHIGTLHQIILESEGGKLIISPYGDLNLCVFTDADANLGLIRVAIRSIQTA